MLLIVGGESDPNTQRVVDQAHIRNMEYQFWNTDLEHCRQIAWDFDTPDLDLGENRMRPDAIFLRWNVFGGQSDRNLAAHETILAYALAWPEIRLLNRQSINDSNNKSMNLRLAKEIGFTIPSSLVMCHLSPLQSHPAPTKFIAKPLNGGAHTQLVSELNQLPAQMLEMPPQFVQQRLEGENLRLFSINGDLTCFHLETEQLDYREDETTGVFQIEVPPQLIAPTQALVKQKSFDYCALDFRCALGFEDPFFLEVNSFPMFVRFDDASQNRLVNGVLDFLTPPIS